MRYYENVANNVTAPSSSDYYSLKSTDLFTSKDKIGHAYASPWYNSTRNGVGGGGLIVIFVPPMIAFRSPRTFDLFLLLFYALCVAGVVKPTQTPTATSNALSAL